MAKIATGTNLISLGYPTVETVAAAVEKLGKKGGAEGTQLVGLEKEVNRLLNELGVPGVVSLRDPDDISFALSLLRDHSLEAPIDDEDKEEEVEVKLESKLGPEKLKELVETYEKAMADGRLKEAEGWRMEIEKAGFNVKNLSPQDPHNVDGFIEEEKRKREEVLRQTTEDGVADSEKEVRVVEESPINLTEETDKRDPALTDPPVKKQVKIRSEDSDTKKTVESENEKITALISELENEGVEDARELVEKATTLISTEIVKPVVDMKKVKKGVEKVFEEVKNQEIRSEIEKIVVEMGAKDRVEKIEAEAVAKDTTIELEKQGIITISSEEEREQIISIVKNKVLTSWKDDQHLSLVEKRREEQTEIFETSVGDEEKIIRQAMVIKGVERRMRVVREKNFDVFETWQTSILREEIIGKLRSDERNRAIPPKILKKWSGLVARLSFNNSAMELRDGVEDTTKKMDIGPGKAEEGLALIKVFLRMISRGNIQETVTVYEGLSRSIPNLSVVNEIRGVRAVNAIMSELRMPNVVGNLMTVRKRIMGIRGMMASFTKGGVKQVVLDLGKKTGFQSLSAFAGNTMALISKEGFRNGLGLAIKSLMATGKVAAVAGGAAGAGGAAVAIGTGPPGWLVAAVITGAKIAKKVFSKIEELSEKLGLSLGIKKWMRENLGKIPGGILGFGVNVVAVGMTVVAGAMAGMAVIVAPVIIFLFAGLFAYQTIFQSSMISSLVGPVNMGAGVGAEVEADLPDLKPENVTCEGGDGASVRNKVTEGIKQNKGDWAYEPLPKGCVFADSGCGPTAVAGVLMKEDGNLTPDKLVSEKGSPYSKLGCEGSTMEQAKKSLEKHHQGKVTFNATTRSCNKQEVANWICEGKAVMVLANFYKNKELDIGGHFFLAVEVKDGEVHSVDPYYDDGAVMDGAKKYGHVQAIRDCMVIEVN